MAGRTMGLYKIIRRIGRGGMGSVYLAERSDDEFRRRVAIKAVNSELLVAPAQAGAQLFDEMIEGDLLAGAQAFARKVVTEKRPLKKVRDLRVEHDNPEGYLRFARNSAAAFAKNFPAPVACVDAVANSVSLPFEEGLRKTIAWWEQHRG